jgi:SP family facilitated glucose transporter-like MFS transporter 8
MSMEKMEMFEAEPLSRTDRRWSNTWPQHLAAGLAALSAVCVGAVDGWTAPAIPHLEQPNNPTDNVTVPGITYDEGSWIGSLSPLGALVGAIPAGYLADLLGRRRLMLFSAVPMLVSWVMIVWGKNSIPVLYTARFIQGFTSGVVTVALPLYSDEIAEVRVRGAVGSYLDLMFKVGMLYVYTTGAILSYVGMTVACTVLPVLFAVTFYWMPESPIYLLTKGQPDKAKKSLRWLRGVSTRHSAEIEDELKQMQSFIKKRTGSKSVSSDQKSLHSCVITFFRNISVTSETMKAMNIIFGLMAFLEICGMSAVLAYTVQVFQTAGSALDPYISTAIFGVVQFVSTLIPIFLVDHVGRRILLIMSGAGMVVCLLAMVIHFHLLDQGTEIKYINWLPLVAVNLYVVAFSVGLGPIPWFMMPELLSNEARGWVSSIAVCLNWAMAFLVTRFFLVMMNVMGSKATYGIFLGICIVGTIFVVVFVPETKGKTREAVHTQLSNHVLFVTGWHKLKE